MQEEGSSDNLNKFPIFKINSVHGEDYEKIPTHLNFFGYMAKTSVY